MIHGVITNADVTNLIFHIVLTAYFVIVQGKQLIGELNIFVHGVSVHAKGYTSESVFD